MSSQAALHSGAHWRNLTLIRIRAVDYVITRPATQLLHCLLDDAAARCPDASAVVDPAGRWSYDELSRRSRQWAAWLANAGVRRGERVACVMQSCRELAALVYASSRLGAICLVISPAAKPFLLSRIMGDAEPRLVVADAVEAHHVTPTTNCPVRSLSEVTVEVDEAGEDHDNGGAISVDPVLLIYTSGSTGTPKGVVCPHRQVLFVARAIASRLEYRSDDVILSSLPMSFDYGLYQLFLCSLVGAELILWPTDHNSFDLLRTMRESSATVVPLVPRIAVMLLRLAARQGRPEVAVRLFTNTGATLTPAQIEALRLQFPEAQVVLMFGLTECKRVSVGEPDGHVSHPGSVGRPLPDTEVRVLGAAAERLGPGEVGELIVRGPHVMSGYWRAPDASATRFHRCPETGEVTLHTGDYGWVDDDGYLYFQGRADDIFKLRGVRVSAGEIEAAALDIAGVSAAAMLPPTDCRDGVLFVAGNLDPADVLASLAERLENQKVPPTCRVLAALPLAPNGKVDRAYLDELSSAP